MNLIEQDKDYVENVLGAGQTIDYHKYWVETALKFVNYVKLNYGDEGIEFKLSDWDDFTTFRFDNEKQIFFIKINLL